MQSITVRDSASGSPTGFSWQAILICKQARFDLLSAYPGLPGLVLLILQWYFSALIVMPADQMVNCFKISGVSFFGELNPQEAFWTPTRQASIFEATTHNPVLVAGVPTQGSEVLAGPGEGRRALQSP